MVSGKSTVAHVVTTEERDALGRIVVNPLAVYLEENLAEAFAARFNENPSTEPRTAEVTGVPLMQSPALLDAPPRGSRSQGLDPEKVTEIRARAAMGETYRQLGAEYGVSPSTISDVVRRRTWEWVL
jgi:hypothetical protein